MKDFNFILTLTNLWPEFIGKNRPGRCRAYIIGYIVHPKPCMAGKAAKTEQSHLNVVAIVSLPAM